MEKEIHALETTQTWILKARLVAKRYTQREGLNFLETFSPVAKIVLVRVLIALASAQRWPLH